MCRSHVDDARGLRYSFSQSATRQTPPETPSEALLPQDSSMMLPEIRMRPLADQVPSDSETGMQPVDHAKSRRDQVRSRTRRSRTVNLRKPLVEKSLRPTVGKLAALVYMQ